VNPTNTYVATLTVLKIDGTRPQSATVDRTAQPTKQPHSAPSDSMTYLAPDITLPRPTIVRLPIARRRTLRRIRRLI